MVLGSGDYKYERVEGWAKIPEYFMLGDVVDVATDSQDRVFVFCRGNHPVLIFDRDGNFVSCWGEGRFLQPHGIFISPDDFVYLVDNQRHAVEKFTLGGELLMTLPKTISWGRRGWGRLSCLERLSTSPRAWPWDRRETCSSPTGMPTS